MKSALRAGAQTVKAQIDKAIETKCLVELSQKEVENLKTKRATCLQSDLLITVPLGTQCPF